MLNSLAAALTMYSRIPVPGFKWSEESLCLMLGFFPAVGVLEGLAFMACFGLGLWLGTGELIRGAMLLAVTLLVTGGIHLDGFSDVHDAIASYADKDRKREIMKDPHTGAFAVMHVCLYMILLTAVYTGIHTVRQAAAVACGFILSRALSALSAFIWEKDLLEGSLKKTVMMSDRKASVRILAVFAAVSQAGIFLSGLSYGAACFLAAAIVLYRYRKVCIYNFGGLSGDCAGWMLVRCELAFAFTVVFSGFIMEAFLI